MTTKQKLLGYLEEAAHEFVSGERLANALNISRNAVWKSIRALRCDGYEILAVPKRGYCLKGAGCTLSIPSIVRNLTLSCNPFSFEVYESLDSTNTLLKKRAASGDAEGVVIISCEQTAGRGRQGREFFSPRGTGLYMSVLLRPFQNSRESDNITTIAAVAAAEAIDSLIRDTGESITAGIKWVNDIFLRGKKVCGILTEAAIGLESGAVDYAVLGIGVNLYPPRNGYPDDLSEIAGTVFTEGEPDPAVSAKLAARFLSIFWRAYTTGDTERYLNEYRARSILIGRDVTVLGTVPKKAHVLAIDDECRLVVRYETGLTDRLNSGEVRTLLTEKGFGCKV